MLQLILKKSLFFFDKFVYNTKPLSDPCRANLNFFYFREMCAIIISSKPYLLSLEARVRNNILARSFSKKFNILDNFLSLLFIGFTPSNSQINDLQNIRQNLDR